MSLCLFCSCAHWYNSEENKCCTKFIDGSIALLLDNDAQNWYRPYDNFFFFIHNCQCIDITGLDQIRRPLLKQNSHSAWLNWFASQTSLRVYKLFLLDENKLEAVLIPLVGTLSMGPNWSYYRIHLFQKCSRCSRCSTLELLCSKYVSCGLWVPAAICSYGYFLTIPYCL